MLENWTGGSAIMETLADVSYHIAARGIIFSCVVCARHRVLRPALFMFAHYNVNNPLLHVHAYCAEHKWARG